MADLVAKGLAELTTDFLDTISAEADVDLNTDVGSISLALGTAASTNDFFMQQQILELNQDSRMDSASDTALDTFVLQFAPAFPPRIAAGYASSNPVPPMTLTADATSTLLGVSAVADLLVGQALRLEKFGDVATTEIVAIQPTRTMTVAAAPNATTLTLNSTAGAFLNGVILLTDGLYTVKTVVTNIISGTQINVLALQPTILHTFGIGTVVTLLGVLEVDPLTFIGGAVLGDFTAGADVFATDMLKGVQFYRNTPDASAPTLPVGVVVRTDLDQIEYEVVEDLLNPNYNTFTQLYTLPANERHVHVKVRAKVAGKASNVLAETLVVLPASVAGFDGAINLYEIQNGTEREEDEDLKTRFRNFVSGLDSGTDAAVRSKIQGARTGIIFSILPNVAPDGVTVQYGHFLVVVSDSDGNLGTDLYDLIFETVDLAKPLTSTFTLIPPTINTPLISMRVAISDDPAVSAPDVRAEVKTELFNAFLGSSAGDDLIFQRLIQIAMDVEGVTNVFKLLVDGNGFDTIANVYTVVGTGPADVPAAPLELIRPPLANIVVDSL